MSLDVQLYVKTCATCSKNKKPRVKPKGELGSYHAGKRMERVHLDMMGPLSRIRLWEQVHIGYGGSIHKVG